jgi:hypothetical protein
MQCLWETLYLSKVKSEKCDDCSKQVTSVCIQWVIQYLIQSGLHTSSHIHSIAPMRNCPACAILFLSCSHPVLQAHSILRCKSHSSGAIVLLTFSIIMEQSLLYEPSFSIGHQLKLGALDGQLRD